MGKIYSIVLLVMIVCSFSCRTQRYIYSPAAPAIPYFLKKGDSKLSAFYSSGDNGVNTINQEIILPHRKANDGFDIQAAYALTNHWAVMFNQFYRKEIDTYSKDKNVFDTSIVNYKRNIAELGVGYFVALNSKKTVTYNIYGGIGIGKFSINENGYDNSSVPYVRYLDNNITKTFLQGGFNFILSEYIRFSLGGRLSFVHYGKNYTSYTAYEQQYFSLDKIAENTIGFFEPTFNMQLGIPKVNWVKIEGSVTTCSSPPTNYPASRGFNASIGLTFDIAKALRHSK
jgi:hypothetical protein